LVHFLEIFGRTPVLLADIDRSVVTTPTHSPKSRGYDADRLRLAHTDG